MNAARLTCVALASALFACSSPKAPECPQVVVPSPLPPIAATTADASRPATPSNETVAFDVQNVNVVGATELLAKRVGEKFTIEASTLPHATCTKITLKVGGAYTAADVLDGLDASLHGSGMRIQRGRGTHQLVSEGNARRASCAIDDATWTKWISAGVKRIDDLHFEITRASLSILATQIWGFIPSVESAPQGKQGLVLAGGGHFAMFAAIGAKSGDLVVSVQGEPIGWSMRTRQIQEKVQTADTVLVAIERGGKPMTLTYRVVP